MRCSRRSSATTSSTAARPKRCATGLLERTEARIDEWKEPKAPREAPRSARRRSPSARRCGRRCSTALKKGTSAGRRRSYRVPPARGPSGLVAVFRRLESTEELRDWDREAIAGLEPTEAPPEPDKKSFVFTLSFFDAAAQACAGRRRRPGDGANRADRRDRRGRGLAASAPRAEVSKTSRAASACPGRPDTRAQRGARTPRGEPELPGAARDPPPRPPARRQELPLHPGPPGSGKTYYAAQLVAELLRDGMRASSRRRATRRSTTCSTRSRRRRARDAPSRNAQPATDTRYDGKWIENEDDIAPFQDEEVRLLAGTAWLFAREELDGTLDCLVIDEAGQMSLADALAMGTSARDLVLVGDPPSSRRCRRASTREGRASRCSSICSATTRPFRRSGDLPRAHAADAPRRLPLHLRGRLRRRLCRSRVWSGNTSRASARASAGCRSSTPAVSRRRRGGRDRGRDRATRRANLHGGRRLGAGAGTRT